MAERGDYGSFIPTTQVWDVSEIYSTEVTSPEFKELLVRLYQNLNMQSLTLNGKDTGMYTNTEMVNGQTFLPDPTLNSTSGSTPVQRQVFRITLNFGALPNTATKSLAHGITITDDVTFTRIYATASDTSNHEYIPLPYSSSVAADNIELWVDATKVYIKTGINRTSYDTCYVVLEYLKQ